MLDYLKGAGAEVTTVGHEQVGGVDTTHVTATLSMGQALDAAGADRARIESSLRQMPGVSDAVESMSFPVDVYLDADGYVRRVTIAYDLGGSSGAAAPSDPGSTAGGLMAGLGLTMTMTTDYGDFGQPVSITEPTPDQTVSLCDVFAQLPQAGTSPITPPAGIC